MKTRYQRTKETLDSLNAALKNDYIEQEFGLEITTAVNLIYELDSIIDSQEKMKKYPFLYDKDGVRKEAP
jgi:hypothetical protein